jgi:hypothetical protein
MTSAPATTNEATGERLLPVDLTKEELHFRALRLAEISKKIDELDERKRSQNQELYRERKDLQAERMALTGVVNTKREVREVKVKEKPDFDRNCIEVIRVDTGEVVDTHPMRAVDRQAEIPGLDGGNVVHMAAPSTKDVAPAPRKRKPRKAPGTNNE